MRVPGAAKQSQLQEGRSSLVSLFYGSRISNLASSPATPENLSTRLDGACLQAPSRRVVGAREGSKALWNEALLLHVLAEIKWCYFARICIDGILHCRAFC